MKCFYCNNFFKPIFGKVVIYHNKFFCSYRCASQYQDSQIIRKHGMRKYHYGILALLLFALFSFLSFNNTHALQYEWSTMPLYQYVFPNYQTYGWDLNIVYTDYSMIPSGFNPINPYYFQGDYRDGECFYDVLKNGYYSNTDLFYSYNIGGFNEYFPSYDIDSFAMCQLYGHSYDGSSPAYHWLGVPISQGDTSPLAFRPYWYKFDGAYFRNSAVDTSSGIHYDHRLRASDLFGVSPGKFRKLVIPLTVNVDIVGSIPAGTPLEVKGVFSFPSVSPGSGFSWAPDFGTDGMFRAYFRGNSGGSGNYADCSIITRSYGDTSGGVSTQLEYSCPIITTGVNDYYAMALEISTTGSSGYVWDTDSDWFWSSMYLITNNDDTFAGDLSMDIHASVADNIPGSATKMFDSDNADWFSSLTNLFNFNIANPFAPIFQMFTDNSQCASIPIIAGMLGSEETTYCPWFDSTTRNILSPVLGLASVMLLFGFFVRWLGSSSGNMFEDQTAHKWSNTTFMRKGGK